MSEKSWLADGKVLEELQSKTIPKCLNGQFCQAFSAKDMFTVYEVLRGAEYGFLGQTHPINSGVFNARRSFHSSIRSSLRVLGSSLFCLGKNPGFASVASSTRVRRIHQPGWFWVFSLNEAAMPMVTGWKLRLSQLTCENLTWNSSMYQKPLNLFARICWILLIHWNTHVSVLYTYMFM